MRNVYLVTHPEVVIDPHMPVPQWPLSERGRARMRRLLEEPWMQKVGSVYSSAEQKARDGAQIVASALRMPFEAIQELGEIDRSSTGYLPHEEHMALAAQFFAEPEQSARGWERAVDAQQRMIAAVDRVIASDPGQRDILIVSHGAVGTLYLCWLKRRPISFQEHPPHRGGGCYYCFDAATKALIRDWRVIDG